VILIQGFEYGNGNPFYLIPSLAIDPRSPFQLVFQDRNAMIFMRQPPPGVQPLPREAVFASLESQCANYVKHDPGSPRCGRGLGYLYYQMGALERSRQWLEFYLSRRTGPDPAIEGLYQQIRSGAARGAAR